MSIRKQNGLTFIGFVIVLALVIFFAYGVMRIGPLYLEYHALINAMNTLQADPRGDKMTPAQIRNKLIDSLWVNYATDNIQRKHMKITRSNGLRVRVAYEVRRDFLGNVDLILSFDRSVTLR
jgi:hypothetical protein